MVRAPNHLRAAPGGVADFPDHLRAAPEGMADFSTHLETAPGGVADFSAHLGATPGGMADFPDHRSNLASPPRIGELRPPPSSAFLASSWSSRPCQAGSLCALGAHGEDLAVVHVVAAHHRPRRGGRYACTCRRRRALCALQSAKRVLRPGRPHCLVGRAPRELGFGPKVV
jgi:hypothetical protein